MFNNNFKKTANIEITTVIGCPVMCSFCPQVSLISNFKLQNSMKYENKILSFDRFKTIINKLPAWVDIHFSGMSEPYAAPECSKMIQYTMKKGHKLCVFSTLVGCEKEDIDLLNKVPFDRKFKLVVHLPDDENNFKAKVTNKYIENLKYFLSLKNIQKGIMHGSVDFMSMSSSGLTDPRIRDLIPHRLGSFIAINRAGNLSNEKELYENREKTTRKNGPIFCTAAPSLNHNVLLPNGDVVLCCMDYSIEHKIGNLLEQSYEELFKSEEITRISNMMRNNEEMMCRNCELARESR